MSKSDTKKAEDVKENASQSGDDSAKDPVKVPDKEAIERRAMELDSANQKKIELDRINAARDKVLSIDKQGVKAPVSFPAVEMKGFGFNIDVTGDKRTEGAKEETFYVSVNTAQDAEKIKRFRKEKKWAFIRTWNFHKLNPLEKEELESELEVVTNPPEERYGV